MTAPMCTEHRCPPRECEGVELTRARHVAVCLCDHPKTIHQHRRAGLDCGLCDCRHYEVSRDIGGAVAVAAIRVVAVLNLLGIAALGVLLVVVLVGAYLDAIGR